MSASSSRFLVLDVGLTHVKASVVSPEGGRSSHAVAGHKTHRNSAGAVEQHAAEWWSSIREALDQIRQTAPALLDEVSALAVTGHMHALVCVDASGEPVRSAMVLGDTRSEAEATAIAAQLGQETIHGVTGARMDPSMPAAKLKWVAHNEPDTWAQTACVMGTKDFLRSRMTGDRWTDPVDAAATSLYDIRRGTWSRVMLEAVDLDESRLPLITSPQSIAGELLPGPAEELGLVPGLPVVVGAGDDVEVLGRGAVAPGEAVETLGTTGSVLAVTGEPVFDPATALETYPHVIEGLWVIGGSMTTAGAAIAWAADTLGYEDVGAAFATLTSGSRSGDARPLFLPHLAGARVPEWNPSVRGAWVGLTPGLERESMMYAVYEGVALGLRSVVDRIVQLLGPLRAVYASDGVDEWIAMRCAAYRQALVVSSDDATAVGSAMLAAVATGDHGDLRAARESILAHRRSRVVEPDPDMSLALGSRYQRFEAFARALQSVWRDSRNVAASPPHESSG